MTSGTSADPSTTRNTMEVDAVRRVGEQLSDGLDRSERLSNELDDQTMGEVTTTESQKYKQSIIEIAGIYHKYPTLPNSVPILHTTNKHMNH